jgi:hypothetical protein
MQHDGERGPTFGATSGEQLVSEDRRSMEDGIIVYQIDMSTEVYDMGLQWSIYFRVS